MDSHRTTGEKVVSMSFEIKIPSETAIGIASTIMRHITTAGAGLVSLAVFTALVSSFSKGFYILY